MHILTAPGTNESLVTDQDMTFIRSKGMHLDPWVSGSRRHRARDLEVARAGL